MADIMAKNRDDQAKTQRENAKAMIDREQHQASLIETDAKMRQDAQKAQIGDGGAAGEDGGRRGASGRASRDAAVQADPGVPAMINPLTVEQVRDDIVAAIEMLNGIPEEQRNGRVQQLLDDLETTIVNYDAAEPSAS